MGRLEGKHALVTGASSGIGASICRELLKEGMTVIGCARSVKKIEAISREAEVSTYKGKLVAIKCDLRKEEDILAMHKTIRSQYGQLDVCVNNAVFSTDSSLLSGSTEDWRNMLEVGVLGLCINTREAVKYMKGSTIGQIIHMGSITSSKLPPWRNHPAEKRFPWFHIYHGMKAMIACLADGLRQELIATDTNIRVSMVTPGSVKTGLLARATDQKTADDFYGTYECLNPEDVVQAVMYILSIPKHASVNDVVVEPVAYHMAL